MSDRLFEALLAAFALVATVVGFGGGVLGSDTHAPGPREPGDIRVMTWNVGGADAQFGHALDDDQVPHVASVIRELDADLVLLQETNGPGQIDRLRGLLGENWTRTVSRGDRPVAILSRTPLEVRRPTVWFRTAFAVFRPASGDVVGRGILVANVHADAFDADRRNRRIGSAARSIGAAGTEQPAILGGDFNLDVDLGQKRELFTADDHRDVETYNYVANRFEDTARDGGSTADPDRRLDYIFVRGLVPRGAGPVKGRRVGDMDHDPVVADLHFPTRGSESSGIPSGRPPSKEPR